MTTKELAQGLYDYCTMRQYPLSRTPGHINIIYLEGSNADGTPNADQIDRWNDRRIILKFTATGEPYIDLNHAATTEPGLAATISKKARALGGVARIQFGQQTAWKVGFHKSNINHPALVQCAPISVFRDLNQDGKRPGDLISPATGINQHGTRSGWSGLMVGLFSEGCLVGWLWTQHLAFMRSVVKDPRYVADKDFVFATTVIPGDDFYRCVS